jgi:hypothetical protein
MSKNQKTNKTNISNLVRYELTNDTLVVLMLLFDYGSVIVMKCYWKWCSNTAEMTLEMVLRNYWFSCKIWNTIVFQMYINYPFQNVV